MLKGMADFDLNGKVLLIREDFNVPMQDGKITDKTRVMRALPSIQQALEAGAKVILMSHLGRPSEGAVDASLSLAPVAELLSHALAKEVLLVQDWQGFNMRDSHADVVLLDNVRFNVGEKACDAELSKQYADLCDMFVMDAFAVSHRAEASTVGVIEAAKQACAGPLLLQELSTLHKALDKPHKPLLAIVGGAKVSDKIAAIEHLLDKVQMLIVGGGIANTFLAAQGVSMGKSLYEADWVEKVQALLDKAQAKGVRFPLPVDVRVGKEFSKDAKAEIKALDAIADDDMILDVGPATIEAYAPVIQEANTIVWNGPLGVFEFAEFAQGTKGLAEAIADSDGYSIAGGGDTLAALAAFNVADKISYVCTGGGAFMQVVEGKPLPAVVALEKKG